jgi:hypothetical protein
MWTQTKTDKMILHAEMETMDSFGRFISAYFSERMPGALEIAQILNVPPELVQQAMMAMTEESE